MPKFINNQRNPLFIRISDHEECTLNTIQHKALVIQVECRSKIFFVENIGGLAAMHSKSTKIKIVEQNFGG